MVHLASPQPGDIVMDPMCGGGTIPIEAASSWPLTAQLCGDNHPRAATRTRTNMEHLATSQRASLRRVPHLTDVFTWDATRMAFREDCIDVRAAHSPPATCSRGLWRRSLSRICHSASG